MKKENENVLTNTIEHVYVPYALVAAITSPVIGWILVKEKGFDFGDLGTFGDFLGGSTVPLLTFITILLLLRTIRIQSNQLEVQKDEFTLLRGEMEDTKIALQEQGKTARMQRFENSFSIQIEEFRKVKSSIENNYNETRLSTGAPYEYLSYKDIMAYISGRIKIYTTEEMATSDFSLENDSLDYFYDYWYSYNNAYDITIMESDELDEDTFNRYFFIIDRIILLIYHNKNVMDKWELEFYIDSLYEEISTEGFSLALFNLAYHSKQKQKVKELDILGHVYVNNQEFIHPFHFLAFEFLLNNSSGAWYKKK
ncbi:hypothetical protein ABEY41_03215 [Peribacillus butanolivorans]|uniref:hypothetical protein n=1 Tax=Peribacillus butanolivorans TaxID=421767 RepID=UPI003D2C3E61